MAQTSQEAERQRGLQKYDTIKKMLLKDETKRLIEMAMPKHVNADRLFQVTITMLRENEDLLKCTQSSLIAGIMGIFKLGLDPVLKQAHLVPFWNGRKKVFEAQMIVDYRGYISLARRSGEVNDVSARPVYEKDEFYVEYGSNPVLKHVPARGERGEIVGAYVVFFFKDGTPPSFEFMSREDIDKRMKSSKAGGKQEGPEGPWREWYEEQATKTVIRHHIKYVPVSTEMQSAANIEERALIGETQTDLLPSLTGDEAALDASPIAYFDERSKALVAEAERPLWEQFLAETAELNKISPDELKAQYKDDVDKMIGVFNNYKKKKATKKEEPAKQETKPPEEKPAEEKKEPPPPAEGNLFQGKVK